MRFCLGGLRLAGHAGIRSRSGDRRRGVAQQTAQGVEPDQVEGLQRDAIHRQGLEHVRKRRQRRLLAPGDGGRQAVNTGFVTALAPRFARLGRQHAVDDQVLLAQADGRQLCMGARDLAQRSLLGARDQDQTSPLGIGQGRDGGAVLRALFLQPCQGTEAGRIALAGLEKAAPGPRQLQQPDGVAGRRGIEDDVIEVGGQRRVEQQRGELVEGRDLRRAGPGELLFDALDHRLGQPIADRVNDALAIALGCGLRVDLQRGEAGHGVDGRDPAADRGTEDLADVRGRISADEEDLLTGRLAGCMAALLASGGQLDCGRAGDRGLAHATFAGEEEKAWGVIEKVHAVISVLGLLIRGR